MIEIKAKLARADSGIYAAGECVECLIEFNNRSLVTNVEDTENHNNRQEERLAWASVQLHCYRKTSYSVNRSSSAAMDMVGRTALDAVTQMHGDVIIATKPKILFCDLKLALGETKTYLFNEFVPRDGPPTYRGHDIKYFYKITIATQRVMSKVQVLTLPIRVLPIPVILRTDELPCTEETNDELAPTNPFLEKREISELEISWHHLKNLTARRAPKSYRISNKRGYVGRFCLFKPCYKIGEDVVGSLDFSNCNVRCVQFSVKLQAQEISLHMGNCSNSIGNATVAGEPNESGSLHSLDLTSVAASVGSGHTVVDQLQHSKNAGGLVAAKRGVSTVDDEENSGKVTTYANSHQVCYCMLQTQVVIPIPLHVTPSFRTNLVDVRWRLHFEFVTSTQMDFGKQTSEQQETGEMQAPAELHVETMVWNLPLTLYAANPLQIYAPNQTYNLLIK